MQRTYGEEEAALIDLTTSWTARALDDTECRRLLATPDFGRLVFTRGALPVVQPVQFRVHDEQLVIAAREGGELSRAVRGAVVAFQVDHLDAQTGAGWTVTAVGPAHVLTDVDDIASAALLGLRTWVPATRYGADRHPARLPCVPRHRSGAHFPGGWLPATVVNDARAGEAASDP
jgi:uncharacterized protein